MIVDSDAQAVCLLCGLDESILHDGHNVSGCVDGTARTIASRKPQLQLDLVFQPSNWKSGLITNYS